MNDDKFGTNFSGYFSEDHRANKLISYTLSAYRYNSYSLLFLFMDESLKT